MAVNQAAVNKAKSGDAAKITEEDIEEMQAWQGLLENSKPDPPPPLIPPRVVLGEEPPVYDLIEDKAQPGARETTYFACGFNESQRLVFADMDMMKLYGLTNSYNAATSRKNGIILLKEVNDDVLSSDRDDKQTTYIPTGDVAIMVANTTNGADQYSVNYECDLNKNILITSADGVEYCMPFDVVMAGRPGGKNALLTNEQLIMAGLMDAPPEQTNNKSRKTAPREDPVTKQKVESGDIRNAETMSDDDPRRATAGGKQIWEGSTGSTKGGKKATKTPDSGKSVSKSSSASSTSKHSAAGAGAKSGIKSSVTGGSSKSSGTTTTATKKTGGVSSGGSGLFGFKPFKVTLVGF